MWRRGRKLAYQASCSLGETPLEVEAYEHCVALVLARAIRFEGTGDEAHHLGDVVLTAATILQRKGTWHVPFRASAAFGRYAITISAAADQPLVRLGFGESLLVAEISLSESGALGIVLQRAACASAGSS